MNATRHIELDELALFAMQLLPADEATTAAQHIEQCEECRRELAAIQGDLATYAHTVDLHSPPALARERLMKQVAREKKMPPPIRAVTPVNEFPDRPGTLLGSRASYLEEDEPQPRRGVLRRILPWTGWALAAGLAVTAGSLYMDRITLRANVEGGAAQLARLTAEAAATRQVVDTLNDPSAVRVTLQKPQTAPIPQARTTYVADRGSLLFTASNMEPLLPYKVYELWLIPADGRDPIPAGTFHPDSRGNASVVLPPLPKGVEAKAFGVTVEDEGGSTTPTPPIILAGSAS